MDLYLSSDRTLPIFKALSNDTRLKMIQSLAEGEKNITTLSKELGLSKAMITRHIQQLEKAHLVETRSVSATSGTQKICSLQIEQLNIIFPEKRYSQDSVHTFDIPIGLYTDYQVTPTCGLASSESVIGELDRPRFFMAQDRVDAELVWFRQGFLEYKIPNVLSKEDQVEMIEISLELASEFPISKEDWPSDISFHLNDQSLGTWTSPGNYADVPGLNNPEWWPRENSQYGLLKHLRIFNDGTRIDSDVLSDTTLSDLDLEQPLFTLRIEVAEDAENVGGLTLFGREFGNHAQHINFKIYYS